MLEDITEKKDEEEKRKEGKSIESIEINQQDSGTFRVFFLIPRMNHRIFGDRHAADHDQCVPLEIKKGEREGEKNAPMTYITCL